MYGLKEQHHITDFDLLFQETGLYAPMMSKDPEEAGQAIADLTFKYFDDQHSGALFRSYMAKDDLVRILTEPKNAMTKQYETLMKMDGVELVFEPAALEAIADRAIDRKIGARGLRSIMESVMTDIMYTVPSDTGIARVVITEDSVQEGGQPVVLRTKDLAG